MFDLYWMGELERWKISFPMDILEKLMYLVPPGSSHIYLHTHAQAYTHIRTWIYIYNKQLVKQFYLPFIVLEPYVTYSNLQISE